MAFLSKRRAAIFAVAAALLTLAAGLFIVLRRQVGAAFQTARTLGAPLQFLPLPEPEARIPRWGDGSVAAVAVTPEAFYTAGGSGIRDAKGELSEALPTLRASALTLWRGEPVAALEAGGLFLRRGGAWEELRTGFGTIHARALLESKGGELLIGAREGLFRAAWGAATMQKMDAAPVQSLAFDEAGAIFAGGETGLREVAGGQVHALASPDPWVQWVGVMGHDLAVITPMGLARGPLGGTLAPVPGCGGATSACHFDDRLFAIVSGRLLSFDAAGHPSEWIVPATPRRLMSAGGTLFVDTDNGLYRRAAGAWEVAQARPAALPPGSSRIGALAFVDGKLAIGFFDHGLAVGDPSAPFWGWRVAEGAEVWGVNALLPDRGGLAVASLRGAARYDGQRIQKLGDGGAAFSIAKTPDGLVIGYGQGVALPDGRFLSAFHGLPGNQALALLQEPDGLLFVGTPTGLGAIEGARVAWRVTAADAVLPNAWIASLALFKGKVYLGTYGGGVARRDAPEADRAAIGTFDPFPETAGFKASAGCLVVAGGTLYFGTENKGLFRLSGDGARFEPVKAPLPSPHITAILPAKDGLFIGTDEGLAKLPLSGEGA
ncbi:MAG: hypothetical protein JST05_07690 [Acidobacteria bacterium]|nr:hypothetical protein [Acidobacteriota bacterium]